MEKDDHMATLIESLCRTHSLLADKFRKEPKSTIVPPRPKPETAGDRALRFLEARRKATEGAGSLTLELGERLGEGGMGVVHEAMQISVGRNVAVKTLHPKFPRAQAEMATLMLMQEAWITGTLEHPNVMPVYDIELDQIGRPLILLKRIGGVNWDKLISDAEQVKKRFGEDNHLEWNLRILQQVCNGVHFAHSRGIIHRDLKPENVMIGEFGEVYVLDWGLALSLEDDGSGRLPLASEARGLAGTPAYMAPEVVGHGDAGLSERTDIYQLGAILHEIISGVPPHLGKSQEEIMASVIRSRPKLPKTAPVELASICRRAMHPDSDLRYDTAEQLRTAVGGFIQHSGSIRLENQAQQRLDKLLDDVRTAPDDERAHRRHLYNLFGECRFAFRQAIDIWPENEVAVDGLRRATEVMIDWELQRGEVRAAATLMAELQNPPMEMQQRLQEAMAANEMEQQRIEKLEHLGKQLDMRTGQRERAAGAGVLGLIWTAAPLLGEWAQRQLGVVDHLMGSITLVVLLVGIVLLRWTGREVMNESAILRRLIRAAVLALIATLILNLATYIMGLDYKQTAVLYPFPWFCVSALLMLTLDWRMLPMTLGYLTALLGAATWPEFRYYLMSGSNLIAAVNMFFIWAPQSWKDEDHV